LETQCSATTMIDTNLLPLEPNDSTPSLLLLYITNRKWYDVTCHFNNYDCDVYRSDVKMTLTSYHFIFVTYTINVKKNFQFKTKCKSSEITHLKQQISLLKS